MEVFIVRIIPTNRCDECGYKTGVVACYDKEDNMICSWVSDSFWTIGNLQCDFDADGGVKIWAFDGKSLRVDRGYTTKIQANELHLFQDN